MKTGNDASENSETKQNQPHNHHFIPQFYLRKFATKDTRKMSKKAQKIYVRDKYRSCSKWEPKLIKHVGSKDNYNTFWIKNSEDSKTNEDRLTKIEDEQANLLADIIKKKSITNIPKRKLAKFVAWMHCRVPFQKKVCEEIQEYNRFLEASAMQCVLPFIPIEANHSYDNGASLEIMYNEPKKEQFLDVLETFRYTLVEIPKDSKKFFITSDNPIAFIGKGTELQARYFVYRFFDTGKKYSSVDEDGKIMTYREQGSLILPNYADFEKKSFDLFLPINPKLGLWLHDNKQLRDQSLLSLPDKDVCFFWHHTINSADEKIYTSEITDELQTFMGNGVFFKNTIEVRRARESRACDYFMKYVCGIEDNYMCEDLVREMKNKKCWDVACVNIAVPGSRGSTKFCVGSLKGDVSTHQLALSEGKRPAWEQKLKTLGLIVLFAPVQTNGVGSHGRKWVSNKEDFHVNLIFYCDQILPFSQIAAYTACQLLARETYQPEYFRIRWPNDVMVGHWFYGWQNFKKIGGCLTAVRKEEARYWVTVGVGINYNLEDFSNIDQPTVSVKSFLNSFGENRKLLYRGNDFTKDELSKSVQKFAELFLKNLEFVRLRGLAAFYGKEDPFWQFGSESYWLYLGQKVTVFDEDKKTHLTGKFEKLTDDGALQLACDNGKTEIVLNGTGLKPAENR